MDRKGTGLVAALVCALALPSYAQGAVGGAAYRCTVVNRLQMQDDGKLVGDEWTKILDKHYRTFTYDSATGVLRWEGGDLAWQYRTVQEGSTQNDLVAVRTMQGVAAYVVEVLRIRPWKEKAPFLLLEQDEVISGTCRKV